MTALIKLDYRAGTGALMYCTGEAPRPARYPMAF